MLTFNNTYFLPTRRAIERKKRLSCRLDTRLQTQMMQETDDLTCESMNRKSRLRVAYEIRSHVTRKRTTWKTLLSKVLQQCVEGVYENVTYSKPGESRKHGVEANNTATDIKTRIPRGFKIFGEKGWLHKTERLTRSCVQPLSRVQDPAVLDRKLGSVGRNRKVLHQLAPPDGFWKKHRLLDESEAVMRTDQVQGRVSL